MKLKSFGCSFIFGTELPIDQSPRSIYELLPNPYTYPSLISKHLGIPYLCHARPGAGNFEILHQILSEISKNEPSLFVINWTWIDRFSYISDDPGPGYQKHPINPNGWKSIMPVDKDEAAVTYYKNFHTQLRDKIETLTCIKTAIDCLRSSHSQFIMTWMDDLIWETKWHCPPSVEWLQKEIKHYLTDFEGMSFLDWSKKNQFPISDTLHPLEDAHRAAADLILSRWDDYIRS